MDTNEPPLPFVLLASASEIKCCLLAGIAPKWGDPMNEDGSRWTLTIPKAREERVLNAFWLDAMLACVGEMLEDSSEVCGLKSPFGHCGMPGPAGLPLPWA